MIGQQPFQRRLVVHLAGVGRRNPVAAQERLAERLARLEAGRVRGRAHHRHAVVAQQVGHAGGERVLGADHGEIDAVAPRRIAHAGGIAMRHLRQIAPELAGSGVARRNQHLLHPRTRRQPPDECVLARAAADYQYPHGTPVRFRRRRASR